ncbi:L,D-transpeptidase [Pectinatus haikarae]|uniref:L,D-TPase catalytic domain-containing protein n=1 Tax=Pectinatus haikarae TaxID=349096 RepID=A0ABT9Y836_9FIRM|nr:L,D-transpeptidase [Pectinatus haikarae]MDQ0203655.1 hypothetical protein [Pectinatus haikarae]
MIRCFIIIFYAFFVFFTPLSHTNAQEQDSAAPAVDPVRLLINIPARWIRLYNNDICTAAYPVAVGKPATPTPTGNFKVIDKEINPTWIDPDDLSVQIPSGEDNPLGYRWIGIGGNYGIHGTNRPSSIGSFTSNGCVRVKEENIEALFPKVEIGTPVKIIYDRLVVEKASNGSIAYYIYPDIYNTQALTVGSVIDRLKTFGVENFADIPSIREEISLANGSANYVGFPINLAFEDRMLPFKAVKTGSGIYLPAYALAAAANLSIDWDEKSKMLNSKYGSSAGIVKNDVVYINLLDVDKVFNLQRDWQSPEFLRLLIKNSSTDAPKEAFPSAKGVSKQMHLL